MFFFLHELACKLQKQNVCPRLKMMKSKEENEKEAVEIAFKHVTVMYCVPFM